MMGSFVMDCLLLGLWVFAVAMLVAIFVVSVWRSADAFERIADALEDDEDVGDEDTEKKGGAK